MSKSDETAERVKGELALEKQADELGINDVLGGNDAIPINMQRTAFQQLIAEYEFVLFKMRQAGIVARSTGNTQALQRAVTSIRETIAAIDGFKAKLAELEK